MYGLVFNMDAFYVNVTDAWRYTKIWKNNWLQEQKK